MKKKEQKRKEKVGDAVVHVPIRVVMSQPPPHPHRFFIIVFYRRSRESRKPASSLPTVATAALSISSFDDDDAAVATTTAAEGGGTTTFMAGTDHGAPDIMTQQGEAGRIFSSPTATAARVSRSYLSFLAAEAEDDHTNTGSKGRSQVCPGRKCNSDAAGGRGGRAGWATFASDFSFFRTIWFVCKGIL